MIADRNTMSDRTTSLKTLAGFRLLDRFQAFAISLTKPPSRANLALPQAGEIP